MKYTQHVLRVKPAIQPADFKAIVVALKRMGYHILGGGTNKDMSICDINFESTDLIEHEKVKAEKEDSK